MRPRVNLDRIEFATLWNEPCLHYAELVICSVFITGKFRRSTHSMESQHRMRNFGFQGYDKIKEIRECEL